MTIVASNSLTVSNVNDGTITHTAYAYSADGTDRFTTVYPNLNLLDGTRDFSGDWTNSNAWVTDGTYKGLTVKKRTAQWNGIYKTFTAPKDGTYTFSAYIKSSGNTANVYRYGAINGIGGSQSPIQKQIGNNFDWTRDSITLNLKANDSVWIRYEISGAGTDSILWVAGYKYESSSTATLYMLSSSEVKTADWPSYIGQYTDFTQTDSTNPSAYTWSLIRGNDGKDGTNGTDGNPGKVVSDTEPTTKFKGLTWKYSGMTAINASDGTNIQPNTEYYWNSKNWVLNQINAQNINVDTLTSITTNLGDAKAGSLTLAKGDTGGAAIKDDVVKTWDISKVTDPNYPDGYSYTSMGAALDSGGITFYSAGYGQKVDQDKVIDDKYKIATLSAVAGNGRQDGGVGLVLDASNPNFPLNIIGNVRIQDTIDLGKVKSVEVPLGWGRSVILTRVGNQVTMFSNKTFSSTMNQGLWSQANEKIPNGYKPYGQVYIYSVSIVNQSKFMWYRLGPSGGVEIWQNGNITTSDTMITPVQSWITSDGFPS